MKTTIVAIMCMLLLVPVAVFGQIVLPGKLVTAGGVTIDSIQLDQTSALPSAGLAKVDTVLGYFDASWLYQGGGDDDSTITLVVSLDSLANATDRRKVSVEYAPRYYGANWDTIGTYHTLEDSITNLGAHVFNISFGGPVRDVVFRFRTHASDSTGGVAGQYTVLKYYLQYKAFRRATKGF